MTDVSSRHAPAAPCDTSRVLVVHQLATVGEALAQRLSREADLDVLGSVTRPLRAVALVPARAVGTVVLDWQLGDGAAEHLAAQLRSLDRPPVLVVLGGAGDVDEVVRVLRAGARAWVSQESPVQTLLEALRRTAAGELWLPGGLLGPVVDHLLAQQSEPGQSPLEALTPRELDVLRCMMAGLGQDDIAARLYLSPNTVRTHRRRTLAKLAVHSSLEAVSVARRAGLPAALPVPRPDPGSRRGLARSRADGVPGGDPRV